MASASIDQFRARREASKWTLIHPIFAIGQLGSFAISVVLLVLFLFGKVSFEAVHLSVLIKIALMIGAIVTGALWEKDVYGKYWFAPEFMLEDTMTVNVFILHLAYLGMAYAHPDNILSAVATLIVAYILYVTNVAQYIWRTMQLSKQTPAKAHA